MSRALRPEARCLITSGYRGDALQGSFSSDNDLEMIQKPFDPDTLLRAVRARLDR